MVTQENLDALQALLDAGEDIKLSPKNKRLIQVLIDQNRWKPVQGFPSRTEAFFGYWTPSGIWKIVQGIKTRSGVLHGGRSTKQPTHVMTIPLPPRKGQDTAGN